MTAADSSTSRGVFVSDFDGTMTRHDFYTLTIERLLPTTTHNHWADYRAGQITHFEALRNYFASIRQSEAEVRAMVWTMELDPRLAEGVNRLRQAGWEVVITSAGCLWYIEQLLADAGVTIEAHANPGRFVEGQGLLMELPTESPFFSPTVGIDKAGVVKKYLADNRPVAFAGDGYPDVDAAKLVPAELRFARADLAASLHQDGLDYRHFDSWYDVVDQLLMAEG